MSLSPAPPLRDDRTYAADDWDMPVVPPRVPDAGEQVAARPDATKSGLPGLILGAALGAALWAGLILTSGVLIR